MPKYDIMGKKKIYFTISTIIAIITIVGFIVNGLQYDVQFSGGTSIKIEMADDKFDPNDASKLVKDMFKKEASAFKKTNYDPDNNKNKINILEVKISNDEGALDSKQFNELLEEFQKNKDFKVKENPNMEIQNIQPAIGKEMRNNGFLAVIISAVCITLYIALRFKLMSGLTAGATAIIALLHDIIVMMGVYVIFKIPINETFIAAILTIIGYSVNDTIIIYDRIRENMTRVRKTNLSDLVNISIIQTLARSINTVVTVLICVISLYIFASINNIESIKQFSFPIIVGITSGAYSSIFIASPLWVLLKDKSNKSLNVKVKAKKA
ncbi:MAG: protein translocase subunit SecF [Clostridiales bacterium]